LKTLGPNRSFGLLLSGGCALLAVFAYRAGRSSAVGWATGAAVFLLISLAFPRVLAPMRRVWLKFGHLLSRVVNPVVLGVAYAAVFVPVAAMMRVVRRDAMARRREPERTSYWIERAPDRRAAERLKEQF
jgi:hypothetical protein